MTFRFKDRTVDSEPSGIRAPLPYDPDEWNRRLAEARVRREATLKERGTKRHGRASIVRTAISGDDVEPARPASPQTVRQAHGTRARPDRIAHRFRLAWRRPLTLVLAGGLAGASLTAAGSVAVSSLRQPAPAEVAATITPAVEMTQPERSATPEPAAILARAAAPPEQPAIAPEPAATPAIMPDHPGASPQRAATTTERTVITPELAATPAIMLDQPVTLDQPAIMPGQSTAAQQVPGPSEQPAAAPERLAVAQVRPAPPPAPDADAGREAPVGIDLAHAPLWVEDPAPGPSPSAAPESAQVVVLAPPTVGGNARNDVTLHIREAGWLEPSLRASPFTVSSTHVRYYHAEDRESAEKLAALFSAGARDFTDLRPSPRTGMVELWLAGGGGGTAPATAPRRTNPIVSTLERIAVALERFE